MTLRIAFKKMPQVTLTSIDENETDEDNADNKNFKIFTNVNLLC